MRARVLAVLVGLLVGLPVALLTPPAGAEERWSWPVAGEPVVVRAFAPPATRYGAGHRGADVAAAPGAAIRAAGGGRVTYAGLLAGRGVVTVTHGALRTTYEPVVAAVRVGQLVSTGEVIGRLAERGHHCTGGCLHWGLLRGEVYLDPVRLVARGPSRLLPPAAGLPATARTGATDGGRPSVAPALGRAPALRPPAEPAFALRAAEVGWGAAALLALAAGLALVRRPARRRPQPPVQPPVQPPGAAGPAVRLIDLAAERTQRRIG